jgi:aspartate/methionine/tyrosine aminotransferase
MTDFTGVSDLPDDRFAEWLTAECGVAPVPGSSFYSRPELGRTMVRFAFCKTMEMLEQAAQRLRAVRARNGR